jgi:hypothetical protein
VAIAVMTVAAFTVVLLIISEEIDYLFFFFAGFFAAFFATFFLAAM